MTFKLQLSFLPFTRLNSESIAQFLANTPLLPISCKVFQKCVVSDITFQRPRFHQVGFDYSNRYMQKPVFDEMRVPA